MKTSVLFRRIFYKWYGYLWAW